MVMQCPCERCMQDSASWNSSSVIFARAQVLRHRPDVGARADVGAAVLAREHRPARYGDGRQVDLRGAHQQRGRGLVAAHQQHGAVDRVGAHDSSTSIEARLRYSIAVGRSSVSPSDITGNSSGKPPASSTPALTCSAMVRKWELHGHQLGIRVADPDDGPPVELVLRDAAVLGPAPIDEAVDVLAPEPLDAAKFGFLLHYLIACSLVVQRLCPQGTSLLTWNGAASFLNASRSGMHYGLAVLGANSVASRCSRGDDFRVGFRSSVLEHRLE